MASGRSSSRRKATAAEVRALAHPLRLRIIRLLYDGPRSNRELAQKLAEDPATVLYHVRTLVRTGFLAAAGTRPGARGRTEKLYRSTGKSWRIDVDAGLPRGSSVSQATLDAFLAELRESGADANLRTSRLALVLTPEHQEELLARVQEVFDEFADCAPDPDGETVALFFALHRRV